MTSSLAWYVLLFAGSLAYLIFLPGGVDVMDQDDFKRVVVGMCSW